MVCRSGCFCSSAMPILLTNFHFGLSVYDFCASNSEWALPSKGSSHPMDTHFRLSKVNRTDSKAYGMPLAIIDTGKYKDMIAGRGGPRFPPVYTGGS